MSPDEFHHLDHIVLNNHLSARSLGSLVIVVDDDAAVRNSLKFSLGVEGFDVHVFSSCEDLLNSADLSDCRCLIVDQRLPGLSGLEFLALLRQRGIATPAVLVTTHPDATVQQIASKAGVPIVEKPFLGNALMDHVLAAISDSHRSNPTIR